MRRSAGRTAIYGALLGLATVAVAEAVRPRGGTAVLLDWDEVRRSARPRLTNPTMEPAELAAAARRYRSLADRLVQPLLDFVGPLPKGVPMPKFEALDREGWLDLNVGILRAFLGTRVLGQYDPQLLGAEPIGGEGLYLVETNVEEWQRRANLPDEDLRRWLILHEMTHAWQFAAHPWLRPYMESSMRELIESVTKSAKPVARIAAFAGVLPAQWRVMRQVQGTMSVVEGYSNLVMNELGGTLLAGFDRLEEAYRKRSSGKSPLEVLIWKLTGLDLKLQQYRNGEAFCRVIFDQHGMKVLNEVWTSEAHMPHLGELAHPEAWYRRVVQP